MNGYQVKEFIDADKQSATSFIPSAVLQALSDHSVHAISSNMLQIPGLSMETRSILPNFIAVIRLSTPLPIIIKKLGQAIMN